jgi:SAM-dependent methyltransferase
MRVDADKVNRRVYHAKDVDRAYRSRTLTRMEALTLLKYQSAFAGRDVLDLGVGTGRTSIYLAPLAQRYEGIDYSPVMIQRIQSNFPTISVRLADIRDLSAFGHECFDFVFGSANIVDDVSPEDRSHVFDELHRVLRDDGVVIFSSHNREYRHALRGPTLAFSRNPITQLKNLAAWTRSLLNNARFRRLYQFEEEFALLCDEAHYYACLHYYIDQSTQRRQLARFGFRVVDVLDHHGRSVTEVDPTCESPWLMYVARREASHGNGSVA